MKLGIILLLFLIFSTNILAQQSAPKQTCADLELKLSMSENKLALERLKVEIAEAKIESLQKELMYQKDFLGEFQKDASLLAGERTKKDLMARQKLSLLEDKITELEKMLAESEKTVLLQKMENQFLNQEIETFKKKTEKYKKISIGTAVGLVIAAIIGIIK